MTGLSAPTLSRSKKTRSARGRAYPYGQPIRNSRVMAPAEGNLLFSCTNPRSRT